MIEEERVDFFENEREYFRDSVREESSVLLCRWVIDRKRSPLEGVGELKY